MRFKENMAKIASKTSMAWTRHGADMMIGASLFFGIMTVIEVGVESIVAHDRIKDTKDEIAMLKDTENWDDENENDISEDTRKEIRKSAMDCALDIGKIFAPAMITGSLSVGCLVCGVNGMHKQMASLAAANATTMAMFKDYRSNVIEKYGKDVDRAMRCKTKDVVIQDIEKDPETGEEKTVTKVVSKPVVDHSDYARVFDEVNKNWERSPDYNYMFLNGVLTAANHKLRSQGYLFLNDVYTALGFDPTAAGQVVGWIYDPSDETRDSRVSFGFDMNDYDNLPDAIKAFMDGDEPSVWLDFNVDGDIIHTDVFDLI